MTVKKGYYLYAIFAEKEPQEFDCTGIGGQGNKVYTLHYQDLAVAVSRVPVKVYDPVRKNAMAHQKVISTIFQNYDVLPVSFGTCVDSYEEVMKLLALLYDQALAAMDKIKNKIEVGLKIFWQKDALVNELEALDPGIKAFREKVAKEGGGEVAYRQLLELGEKLELLANNRRNHYKKLLIDPLQKIAADVLISDNINNEKIVVNASFLVDKAREEEFDRAVNDIYNRYSDGLEFKYTGPWPPYSFIDMKFSLEE
ncbi:Gas vesicle synthesis protein GvpL/GvpF [Desulfotomaculum arcticum]|uniref:Gas vesicle synthesis protein GvpL/GvpF n=1 Tax=Desulfotruncus arcticus DSM 17038 TaxID=1121424 RepID=A0A1I2VMG2_9FIRM|nr:GvpL/GvpF family gas vesicle protein [Desulfotruncus arcticus]SFG88696.1 Gas vesicle synthesis protein GvpL/GvpF [Desulfotomaculum arcticum] [Desulfotruncus arcticus DSM 17038]